MEKLTRREEELMRCFWEHGPLFVRELVALATEPKPHFNTLSTMVRALEAKGYVAHNTFGSTYQYYPVVTEEEFSRRTLGGVISKYFEKKQGSTSRPSAPRKPCLPSLVTGISLACS